MKSMRPAWPETIIPINSKCKLANYLLRRSAQGPPTTLGLHPYNRTQPRQQDSACQLVWTALFRLLFEACAEGLNKARVGDTAQNRSFLLDHSRGLQSYCLAVAGIIYCKHMQQQILSNERIFLKVAYSCSILQTLVLSIQEVER